MRKLLCLALLLAACAREKPRPATPAEKYAGTWEGSSVRDSGGAAAAFTIQMTASAEGALSGSLTFTGTTAPPVPVRTEEVSDSVIVFEIGPYMSPTAGKEVITRSTGRVSGDSLWGTYEMLPTAGGGVVPDMSAAQWSNAALHPAPGSEPIRGTFTATRRHTS